VLVVSTTAQPGKSGAQLRTDVRNRSSLCTAASIPQIRPVGPTSPNSDWTTCSAIRWLLWEVPPGVRL